MLAGLGEAANERLIIGKKSAPKGRFFISHVGYSEMDVSFKVYKGYAFGLSQPSVVISFNRSHSFSAQIERRLVKLQTFFAKPLQDCFKLSTKQREAEFLRQCETLLSCLYHLGALCGDLQLQPGYFFEDEENCNFALPTLSPSLVLENLKFIVAILAKIESLQVEQVTEQIRLQVTRVKILLPAGTNTGNLIKACAELEQPYSIFKGQYLIVGYGKYSKIFNSTVSEDESATGVLLAKSKSATRDILLKAGLPVTNQRVVRSGSEAMAFSKAMGFPLVLKEERGDKGSGVHANIQNSRELADCCAQCSFDSKRYVIEKHVPGDDYRVITISGQVVRCVKRSKPNIIGDGKSKISDLINRLNSDASRSDPHNVAEPIVRNYDMDRILAQQSMKLSSIPKFGQYVQLGSGNGSGIAQEALPDMCEENKVLFEQVARTLNLDVAGIDFISEDISLPWNNSVCAICEVNAQPQLGSSHPGIYKNYINSKIRGRAHVKVIIGHYENMQTNQYNKALDCVTVKAPVEYIVENGLPVSYYSDIEISPDIAPTLRKKLRRILNLS